MKKRWSEAEQNLFMEGLELYGNKSKNFGYVLDIKKVAEHVGTRSVAQVRSHLQKHQLKEKKGKTTSLSN
jgi:SHAQKYF class myb-like DNA-binding protein